MNEMNARSSSRTGLGVVCMITAFFFVAAASALVKGVSATGLPTEVIVFFESLIPLSAIIIWHLREGPAKFSVASRHPLLQIVQGVVGFLTAFLLYLAVKTIPTVNGVLLNSSAPLFIPIICYFLFKNKINLKLIGAIAVGFIGIALILKPSASLFDKPGVLIALLSGIAVAFDDIIIGRLDSYGEKTDITMFYVFLMTTVLSGLLALTGWRTPTGIQWLYLLGIGVAFLGIQLFLVLALSYAPVTEVSPFMYFGVVFAGIIDWIFWGMIPGLLTLIGIILVIAGAVASILLHKRTHPRRPPKIRKIKA